MINCGEFVYYCMSKMEVITSSDSVETSNHVFKFENGKEMTTDDMATLDNYDVIKFYVSKGVIRIWAIERTFEEAKFGTGGRNK